MFDPRWISSVINCDAVTVDKIYDIKPIKKEDALDADAYSHRIWEAIEKNAQRLIAYRRFTNLELPLTPKSIEQSADHKTVVVIWIDGSKTIVRLSPNDKDDIVTAFTYAMAKKIFGTNTHLKKVVMSKVNEHKPKEKKNKHDSDESEV